MDGAHPKSSSQIRRPTASRVHCARLLTRIKPLCSATRLPPAGELPFLFKVLCAAQPLSIQVHPNKQASEEGFARENAAGIPLSAAERNYKDPNHKPELVLP